MVQFRLIDKLLSKFECDGVRPELEQALLLILTKVAILEDENEQAGELMRDHFFYLLFAIFINHLRSLFIFWIHLNIEF